MIPDTNNSISSSSEPPYEGIVGALLDGRYRVLGRLGKGGMGLVYEGEHVHVGRRVALKFVRRDLAAHPKMLEQFRFEARAAGRICSDNVAAVLDFGVTGDGLCYLVMERLRGETLAQRIERLRTLPARDAASIVAQASRGAAAAHRLGIVHCDIKPSNLFIAVRDDGAELVKLLDFGVARLATALGASTPGDLARRCMGTPSYMSPEQAAANPELDARTDVYALGAVLYRILSGELPHKHSDPIAMRCGILRDDVPGIRRIRPEVPPELADIVHRALARQIADRYASAEELAAALEQFAGSGGDGAHPRRAPALDPLPETCADPPTATGAEGTFRTSTLRHAVALDVVMGRKGTSGRPWTQRWRIWATGLAGTGTIATLALRLLPAAHQAPAQALASSLPWPHVVAMQLPAASSGVRSEGPILETSSSAGAVPATTPDTKESPARRREARRGTSLPPIAARRSTEATQSSPSSRTGHAATRNYDQFVGF